MALTWDDAATETAYYVYRHTADTFGSATLIWTNAANDTTYDDDAATPISTGTLAE